MKEPAARPKYLEEADAKRSRLPPLEVTLMFWLGIAVAAAVIGLLTWLGARMVQRNPDTAWEKHEDRPIVGDRPLPDKTSSRTWGPPSRPPIGGIGLL